MDYTHMQEELLSFI